MEGIITIQGMPADQFTELLSSIVADKVTEAVKKLKTEDLEDKYLSASETCKLFQPAITRPTLEAWSEKGLLKKHVIGSRSYWLKSDVTAALKNLKRYNH